MEAPLLRVLAPVRAPSSRCGSRIWEKVLNARGSPLTGRLLSLFTVFTSAGLFALGLIYIVLLFRPRRYEYAAFAAVSAVVLVPLLKLLLRKLRYLKV